MDVYFKKIEKQIYSIGNEKIKEFRPCALHNGSGDFAVIDIDMMIQASKRLHLNINKMFAHAISHEHIHSILERWFDDGTTYAFDDLYAILKKKKNQFHIMRTGL